ncbi:M15 family metallopeptidase [uncultured Phascolarctobacterium sp.]|uniref:M15 family metallopeptidase n=1 Tax=uncultured Phascolarctobacterium sp. TaxID=512296 RepID=UPI0027DD9A8C|nr:M15 family metallopeptidase [uncultured Phascolarctobacterium sp.]
MNYRNLLAGLAAGLLFYVQTGAEFALAAVPDDAPKDIKYILGFYYGNGENILIRENNGRLELLYRTAQEDRSFAAANLYPLSKVHFDSYTLQESGPMSNTEAGVRFERDTDGYGISCRVGGNTYSRYFLGTTQGERAKPFRLEERSAEEWTKLRTEAAKAAVPAALAAGEQAQLVDAASVAGLKVNSVYAGSDNLFGAPLYSTPKLFVAKDAAAALGRVQQRLAPYGYGLVLWDAYRPWSVSKLANLALPEGKKDMLEDPEVKGSVHNTGNAVDVGLYSLDSGEELDMGCGFDEPSLRQYASYAGGTSRERYLRSLLREEMELQGFKGIEMEWWHFEFGDCSKFAHLNVSKQ